MWCSESGTDAGRQSHLFELASSEQGGFLLFAILTMKKLQEIHLSFLSA
jgi:hypothetical protein